MKKFGMKSCSVNATIPENVFDNYEKLKKGELFSMVLGMSKKEEIELISSSDKKTKYESLMKSLPNDTPRFLFTNYVRDNSEDNQVDVILFLWMPKKVKPKVKMLYSTCCSSLKSKCKVDVYMEVDDKKDVTTDVILEKLCVWSL